MFGGLFWLGDLDLDLSLTLVTRVLILMLCSLQDAASRQEILGCGRRGESQAVPHDSGRRAVNLYFPTLLLFCRQIIAAALITLDGRSLKSKQYLIQFSFLRRDFIGKKVSTAQSHVTLPSINPTPRSHRPSGEHGISALAFALKIFMKKLI